jgi:hypothetical protein
MSAKSSDLDAPFVLLSHPSIRTPHRTAAILAPLVKPFLSLSSIAPTNQCVCREIAGVSTDCTSAVISDVFTQSTSFN